MTQEEFFQRYVWHVMRLDSDAMADMYAEDGAYEAPLVPAGGAFPRRVEGRETIREFFRGLHGRLARLDRTVDVERSRYVVHTTGDPDTFLVEVDTAFKEAGETVLVSLVYIFRLRDGKIALLRDYFAPEHVA